MPEKPSLDALTQDINVVEQEYRKNVTVVTARPRIVQAVFVAWGAVVAIMVLFFLVTVGWYGVQGIFEDNAYENALLQNNVLTQSRLFAASPQGLLLGSVQSVPTGSGASYDLYIEVENPNTRHAAVFSYTFSHDDGSTDEKESFLNPGEKAYILAPRATTGKPKNASFSLADISWIYLSRHDIANINAWYAEHTAFSVSDVVFARDIAYADAVVSRTTFLVANHTPYAYWEPTFTVRVLRGSVLLGMAEITAAKFKAGEERTIDMRWFGELPQTATVTVTPRIPFFNEDAYMNPEESRTDDVRNRWTVDGS
ncbi:MAG: hypothetical protein AAB448_01900 [Patescibacteria group bacterium]